MRFRKIPSCCSESIVQISNTVSTKDLIRDHMSGRMVSLPGGADSRSYDFPDGRTDWDKASISEAPDLIEQSFMKDAYIEHLNPKRPGKDQTDVVIPPVVTPDPVPDPTPGA